MRTGAKHFIESVLISGDQLLPHHPLLDPAQSRERSVVLIESLSRMRARRYHKQKVALVLSAMRHYAEALRVGVPVQRALLEFLLRFEKRLRANPRMGPNVLGLKHLDETERQRVRQQAEAFLASL